MKSVFVTLLCGPGSEITLTHSLARPQSSSQGSTALPVMEPHVIHMDHDVPEHGRPPCFWQGSIRYMAGNLIQLSLFPCETDVHLWDRRLCFMNS